MSKKYPSFRDTRVWQLAHALSIEIYQITEKFPKSEIYGLTSQLRRASTSVNANISEGFYRETKKEMIRFLYQARGSCGELINFVMLSKDLGYISEKLSGELESKIENIGRQINAWINALKIKKC